MPTASLATENRLETLLMKLEETFGKQGLDQAFDCYLSFEVLKRGEDSVAEYIHKFELDKHSMKLPDSVLACKVLYSANLGEHYQRIILATTGELTFKAMNTALHSSLHFLGLEQSVT